MQGQQNPGHEAVSWDSLADTTKSARVAPRRSGKSDRSIVLYRDNHLGPLSTAGWLRSRVDSNGESFAVGIDRHTLVGASSDQQSRVPRVRMDETQAVSADDSGHG